MDNSPDTAKGRYESLSASRSVFLEAARECSKVTIPALIPLNDDRGSNSNLPKPYQSVGSRGVNHLAAKLMLALFPPGTSFFRFALDPFLVQEGAQQAEVASGDVQAEMEKALSMVERAVVGHMESNGHRTALFEALRHLVVGGNVLLELTDKDTLRYHRISHFVVSRDRSGNVLEIIVREGMAPTTLSPEARSILSENTDTQEDGSDDKSIDVYTWIRREGNRWKVHQEISDKVVPKSDGSYPLDKSPWVPLRWSKIDGEDYSFGYVYDFLGDLLSLESLSRSIVMMSAAASKILIFVDDSGTTNRKKVAEAESGDVLPGDADDISAFQLDKYPDFQVASATAERIERRVEQAFMLFSGLQRNAERVTAEEIRALINELEQSLGGVYSVLAQELQLPLVNRIFLTMQRRDKLPALPKDVVKPQVITGVDALGRTADLARLDALVAGLAEMFGPEAVARYFSPGAYLTRRAAAIGIDVDGLVRSEQEVQSMLQAERAQQMTEKLGPAAVKAGTELATASPPQEQNG